MDTKSKERIIRLLLILLGSPGRYTKKELSDKFDRSEDTIKKDLICLRNAGLTVEHNKHYQYSVIPENQFEALKQLQPLSDNEKAYLGKLVDKDLPSRKANSLKNKLNSLYDFQKLGLSSLRRPALERIERLEDSINSQKQVLLKNYRSNSNSIKDRLVEVFLVNPELDTVQAFDVDKKDVRHFRLSRIQRVEATEKPWQFEGHHVRKHTDVFRISDNKQINVHLTLNVYAYNALLETFPMAKSAIEPGAEKNTFDFQSSVNHQFLGLINFIMGNARHITIESPEALKDRVRQAAEEILKKNT